MKKVFVVGGENPEEKIKELLDAGLVKGAIDESVFIVPDDPKDSFNKDNYVDITKEHAEAIKQMEELTYSYADEKVKENNYNLPANRIPTKGDHSFISNNKRKQLRKKRKKKRK